MHRRVARRKADRVWVLPKVVETQWRRLADEKSEDASPAWKVADCRPRLGIDPGREEPLERGARSVDYTKRSVVRARQLGGRLGDPLQDHIERQLRAERDAGIDECAHSGVHIPHGGNYRGSWRRTDRRLADRGFRARDRATDESDDLGQLASARQQGDSDHADISLELCDRSSVQTC